jgi:hypothetical protein
MYGVELDEAWDKSNEACGLLYKKVPELPNCAVNGIAKMELGRDSGMAQVIWLSVKYWQ